MGLMDILRRVNGAQYEQQPEYSNVRIGGPSMEGEPDPSVGDPMNSRVVQTGQHPTGKLTTFGKITHSLPDILRAGIAGAATPNVAGGGPTDVFRAMGAGQHAVEANHENQRDILRQRNNDEYQRQLREAQIRDIRAQEQERLHKASLPARFNGQYMNTGHGVFDVSEGKYVPLPENPAKVNAPGAVAPGKLTADEQLAAKGARPFSPVQNIRIPTLSPVPGQEVMNTQITNRPLPEGFHGVPGHDSGEKQLIMENPEHVMQRATESKIEQQDNAAANREDLQSHGINQRAATRRPLSGHPAASITAKAKEREALADQQGLTGEERKQFVLNGRISARAPKKADFTSEIDQLLGGGSTPPPQAPPAVPQAGSGKPKVMTLPPEIVKQLPVGKNTRLKAPDGTEQMWLKNPDGTVKRLR